MRLTELDYIEQIRTLMPSEGEAPLEAVRLADEAVAAFPSSAKLWCLRGDLIQLSADEPTHSLSEALRSYTRAVEVDSECAEAFESIGFFHDAVLDDPASAEPAFRKAISLGGGVDSYVGLARVLAELNDRDEALQVLNQANCPYHLESEIQTLRDEIASGVWRFE